MSTGWSAVSAECEGVPLNAGTRVDAYLPWDRLTKSARHEALARASRTTAAVLAPTHVPVLVQFKTQAGAAGLNLWCTHAAVAAAGDAGMLPHAFAASVAAAPASAIHSALLPLSAMKLLTVGVEQGLLERFQLGAPCVYAGPPTLWPAASTIAPTGRPGAHTLGIIDDGCCFAHQNFRTASGACRVHALWDQTPAATPGVGWFALRAFGMDAPYPYGVELTKAELDALLARHPGFGEAAEQALYASIGCAEWGRNGHTHGARVMHLAVGAVASERMQALSDADCKDQPIVFVQLPRATVRDVTGDSLGMQVVDGVRYIVARARELAGGGDDWKATVNISLGCIGGPHDGTSMAEQALAELVAQHAGRVTLVMAAGNTAGDDARIHAHHAVPAGGQREFLLRLPPVHRRDCFVEFWFHTEGDPARLDDFALDVITPDAHRLSAMKVGQCATLTDAGGQARASLVFPRSVAQGMNDSMALLSISPTLATPDVARSLAAPGIWRITVANAGKVPASVHAWIERDDVVVGRRRGQQARFEPLSRLVEDASVNDDFTLSNLANAARVIVVGGYVKSTSRVARYSANGPLRVRATITSPPAHFAASDRSRWLSGLAVPGFYSGSHATLGGTSAAAPQVARALIAGDALQLAERPMPQRPPTSGVAVPAPGDLRPARPQRPLPHGALVLR